LIAKQKLIDSAHLATPDLVEKPAVVVPTPVQKKVK
jgi:hypothetical protein